jgi:hypothetical protein
MGGEHVNAVYPHEVTGFAAAADVLQRVGGVLLAPDAAAALALALIGTVEPHLKADVLADLADDLGDQVRDLVHAGKTPAAVVLWDLSIAYDRASHEIRKRLHG